MQTSTVEHKFYNAPIAITAMGVFTSLGLGIESNLNNLVNSQDGLTPLSILPSVHRGVLQCGELKYTDAELKQLAGIDDLAVISRASLISIIAIKEIISQLPPEYFKNKRIGFVNASTGGGMSMVEQCYFDFISENPNPDLVTPNHIDILDCARSTTAVLDFLPIKPIYVTTISTACSSSANAIIVGSRLLKNNVVDAVICGGCDAFSKFTINGFLSLKNVSKEKCLPFDEQRQGLNLGEGAAYLLLERKDELNNQQKIFGLLKGYANVNDTYHPTAPSPDGSAAVLAMSTALKSAQLTARDIDYINAHGTATESNDNSELKAIQDVFGQNAQYSSTKCFVGHTLAAAGAIEAVYSILSIQENKIWSNLRWQTPMENMLVKPVTTLIEQPVNNVISNSFGFGGNNVSLIFGNK